MFHKTHASVKVNAADGTTSTVANIAAHICFHVDDLYVTLLRIEALGAKKVGEITEFDEGLSVYCWVPGGAYIEVEQIHTEKV